MIILALVCKIQRNKHNPFIFMSSMLDLIWRLVCLSEKPISKDKDCAYHNISRDMLILYSAFADYRKHVQSYHITWLSGWLWALLTRVNVRDQLSQRNFDPAEYQTSVHRITKSPIELIGRVPEFTFISFISIILRIISKTQPD